MTTSWKRTETADCAGAAALYDASAFVSGRTRRVIRALRWKTDAVCRETAAAAAGSERSELESSSSSLTRTIFFSSRIQTQPTTRKETLNTTQEKKGKQAQTQ